MKTLGEERHPWRCGRGRWRGQRPLSGLRRLGSFLLCIIDCRWPIVDLSLTYRWPFWHPNPTPCWGDLHVSRPVHRFLWSTHLSIWLSCQVHVSPSDCLVKYTSLHLFVLWSTRLIHLFVAFLLYMLKICTSFCPVVTRSVYVSPCVFQLDWYKLALLWFSSIFFTFCNEGLATLCQVAVVGLVQAVFGEAWRL